MRIALRLAAIVAFNLAMFGAIALLLIYQQQEKQHVDHQNYRAVTP